MMLGQEYYYRIQDVVTGKYYSGSKYGKDANPNTFWKHGGYFTSSKFINGIIDEFGVDRFRVCKIIILKDSYNSETRFLRRIDAKNNNLFYNGHNNVFGEQGRVSPEARKLAGKKSSITKNDPNWKSTKGIEQSQKQSKTKNDPNWKSTKGVESYKKLSETMLDENWRKTKGVDWSKKVSATKNDPNWKSTKGIEQSRKLSELQTDENWKSTKGVDKSKKISIAKKLLASRQIVFEIKQINKNLNIKLGKGWTAKSNEVLEEIKQQLLNQKENI